MKGLQINGVDVSTLPISIEHIEKSVALTGKVKSSTRKLYEETNKFFTLNEIVKTGCQLLMAYREEITKPENLKKNINKIKKGA